MVIVYSENHAKHANTIYGQNAGFINDIAGGAYSYPVSFEANAANLLLADLYIANNRTITCTDTKLLIVNSFLFRLN
jgi:hypothetical protein